MGAANTKSKRKAETTNAATKKKPIKLKIDQNPLFAEIANIDTILYTHFAIVTRFPGLLPKELLATILLDMRIEASRYSPSTFVLSSCDATTEPDLLCMMGCGGCGKSCLIMQLINNTFITEYDPTIEDSYRKLMEIDNVSALLDILDTAGQEEFAALMDAYIRARSAFMLVYPVTSRLGFEEITTLVEKIKRVKDVERFPLVIVGTKIDLVNDRVVSTREGQELARKYDCPFYEASAKTRVNVEVIFADLVRENRKDRRDAPVRCGRRPPRRGMCGILAADPSDPCALPKIASDVDFETVVASSDGCCHSIVEERYEVVWEQLMRLFPSELSAKEKWKDEICRPLSLEAMKRVTEISELDSQLAEAILQCKNIALISSS